MELQLKSKRALVSGSNSGIGEGIVKLLAEEGAIVVVHGRDRQRTEAVAEAIRAAGGEALGVTGDLATDEGCRQVADFAIDKLGGIDILVNNAGGKASGHRHDGKERLANAPWFDTPWDDWRWTYEQNMGAAVRMIQLLGPGMVERGFGRIINIASASGTQPPPDLADYTPAKAAMINMTSGLAKTLGSTGVTVNTVTPGTILTPALTQNFIQWAEQLGWETSDWDEIERRFTTELMPQPINRFGRPSDIARMVALVASPLSSFMTGTNYRIDGGFCQSVN